MQTIDEKVLNLLEAVRVFRRSNDYSSAWEQLRNAFGICPEAKHGLMGRLKAMKGQLIRDEGNTQKAVDHYQQALEHFRNDQDQLKTAHTLRHLAEMEGELNHMGFARQYFEQCFMTYESHVETSKMDLANFYRAYALFLEKDNGEKSPVPFWVKAKHIYAEYGISEGVQECDNHLQV